MKGSAFILADIWSEQLNVSLKICRNSLRKARSYIAKNVKEARWGESMKIRGRNIEMTQFTIYFTFFRFLIASHGVSLAFFLEGAICYGLLSEIQ